MMRNIARSARSLRWATQAALIVVLAVSCYAILTSVRAVPEDFAVQLGGDGGTADPRKLWASAVGGVCFAIGLWHLIRMLRLVERGETFERRTVAELRAFTLFVLISALISIVVPIALALVGVLASEPGPRQLTMTFGGGDFFSLLISALLYLLARLLGEAGRIAEDSRLIV